ncbi:MAG: RNA polymerase sigma factor [Planctomycetota bacterium]|jgi:RNA polymerase sigma-70 factor (ECF subfamily)
MDPDRDYTALVRQAQLGDRESLDRLAQLTQGRLYAYVYRMVLNEDLAQEIVQESLLEMYKVFGNLERTERFWPWLRGIAFNKTRRRRQQQQRERTVSLSDLGRLQDRSKNTEEGLADLVGSEIKQIVIAAMRDLRPKYRKVLAMRCYEEMEYSEIAELMGASELSARVTFFRAKRALQKALVNRGLGKGFMLTALILFGKLTAPSKAAAGEVTVTAAATKVGAGAALLGLAASKTAVVSLAAAGALAVGTVVTVSVPDAVKGPRQPKEASNTGGTAQRTETIEEYWYYLPGGADGPVMMRLMQSDSAGQAPYCVWRQNERANYFFDKRRNVIRIENHRMWRPDLSVWRLPTDRTELTRFVSSVEGRGETVERVPLTGDGLLVVAREDISGNGSFSKIVRQYNVLDEEYFRYEWPAGMKTIDNRDQMHKRGWTYFRITGHIAGQKASGTGRMPFVYAAGSEHWPWLKLRVGSGQELVDRPDGSLVYDRGKVVASYEGGTFFKGLARPWMGLHAVDTVRRDAAEEKVRFDTSYLSREKKAEIALTGRQSKIVYTIDLETDVIETITISTGDGREGQLRFSYLQDITKEGDELLVCPTVKGRPSQQQPGPGMLWLLSLIEGDFVR